MPMHFARPHPIALLPCSSSSHNLGAPTLYQTIIMLLLTLLLVSSIHFITWILCCHEFFHSLLCPLFLLFFPPFLFSFLLPSYTKAGSLMASNPCLTMSLLIQLPLSHSHKVNTSDSWILSEFIPASNSSSWWAVYQLTEASFQHDKDSPVSIVFFWWDSILVLFCCFNKTTMIKSSLSRKGLTLS